VYAGGEKWFVDSGVEKRLDLPMFDSVSQFIKEFGKDYLLQSHSYLLFNIEHGCLPIKFEELQVDFNGTMSTWLDHWRVKEQVKPRLLELMQAENPLNRHHVPTNNKYFEPYIAYVNGAIDAHDGGSMKRLIEEQAEELHYQTPSDL
jgi:hypothetical protein